MSQEKVLLNKCNIISKEVTRIDGEHKSSLGDFPLVLSQLTKTVNRSREYENGTFIVLVVGPVKSGKSTLVNLIAREYVSPTHFLECTVRPSIISQRQNEEKCKITVFTSEETKERVEQIDAIIDFIRGMEKEESLNNIKKVEYDLTRENIEEKVELGLKDSLTSETLVTSITTPGGKLMKQNVFIVDMPGFDGEYANIDDPVYDTIAQRADLLIFVQSSNSAISKVSEQFLKKLSENNHDVPVCLIHNVFDSSWWHTEEERSADILEQKEFAIKEIQKLGFNIEEEQCFSINLGKVKDGCTQKYEEPSLQNEVKEYERIEKILYDRIINRRDTMRLLVCLSRTNQQLKRTIEVVENELEHRSQLDNEYREVQSKFDEIKDTPNFGLGLEPLTLDYKRLKDLIIEEAKRTREMVSKDTKLNNEEAKRTVIDFIRECEKIISSAFRESLSLESIEKKLFQKYEEKIQVIKRVVSNSKKGLDPLPINSEQLTIPTEDIPSISLLPAVNLAILIPSRIRFARFGGHSGEDVVSYINKAATSLAGSSDGATGTYCYLEQEGGAVRPILQEVENLLEEIAHKYEEGYRNYWDASSNFVLGSIIENKDIFDKGEQQLQSLKKELKKIEDNYEA